MAKDLLTANDIGALRWSLETIYQPWHLQQETDERFFNLEYEVMGTDIPDNYEQVRPPTASRLVNTAANHTAGNMPKIHVPRRSESPKAQERSTLMEKAGQGFWYRNIAASGLNPLRALAQDAYLKGAIGAALLYDPDAYPEYPSFDDMDDDERKETKHEIDGLRRSAWPFKFLVVDPRTMFPDPETDGQTYIIIAFQRYAYDVKRLWPNWDYTLPDSKDPLRPTDFVEFMAYWDKTHKGYFVGGTAPQSMMTSLQKIGRKKMDLVEHGYGFLPYFFAWAGLGQPHGLPRQKGPGLVTKVRDLITLQARRMTHLDAIIAQNAWPLIAAGDDVNLNMALGGVMRVPSTVQDVRTKVEFFRPQVPIQEIILELRETKQEIESATVPDALGGQPTPTVYSGFQNLQILGAGRSNLRPVVDALERCIEWGTAGFYKLVENKVPGPVAIWGKGMSSEDEFVTIKADDIQGHYEVYASLEPALPQDISRDIADWLKLFEHGLSSGRLVLEKGAHIENAEEVLRERLAEDLAKSPEAMQAMMMEVMKLYGAVPPTGPIAAPGFTSGQVGLNGSTIPATADPTSNAGVTQTPTPPAQAGSVAEANIAAAQASGAPVRR